MKIIFKIISIIFVVSFAIVYVHLQGCKKPKCSNSGTSVNINGGGLISFSNYATVSPVLICSSCPQGDSVYYTDVVYYSDPLGAYLGSSFSCGQIATLTTGPCGNACIMNQGTIIDVGQQTCPASFSGSPTASSVSYNGGDGYVCNFPDGHTVKFIAGSINNGVVSINYIFK